MPCSFKLILFTQVVSEATISKLSDHINNLDTCKINSAIEEVERTITGVMRTDLPTQLLKRRRCAVDSIGDFLSWCCSVVIKVELYNFQSTDWKVGSRGLGKIIIEAAGIDLDNNKILHSVHPTLDAFDNSLHWCKIITTFRQCTWLSWVIFFIIILCTTQIPFLMPDSLEILN